MKEIIHVWSSHVYKLPQRLPLRLMFIVLATLQMDFSTNGFASLRELQGTTTFLPLYPRKNQPGSAEISRMLHANDLLPRTVEYLSPSEIGGRHVCADETKFK